MKVFDLRSVVMMKKKGKGWHRTGWNSGTGASKRRRHNLRDVIAQVLSIRRRGLNGKAATDWALANGVMRRSLCRVRSARLIIPLHDAPSVSRPMATLFELTWLTGVPASTPWPRLKINGRSEKAVRICPDRRSNAVAGKTASGSS